jgi:hypothetical protein
MRAFETRTFEQYPEQTFAASLLGGEANPRSSRSSFDRVGALELLLGPMTGSASIGEVVEGVVDIHVDDAYTTGAKYFVNKVVQELRKAFQARVEDANDVFFVGQRATWVDREA